MTDTKILDGTVDDVKTGLAGLDAATLAALLAAENAGKTRKGVLDAITDAISALGEASNADTDRGDGAPAATTANTGAPAAAVTTAASLDTSAPADIAPATAFEPSGAPIQSSGFDLSHAALDVNPRANTTEDQNRIDFNDPVRTGEEIVTERLKAASSE